MSNAILLLLILLDAFVCFSVASVVSRSPAASPSSSTAISGESQAPLPRKLGKLNHHKTEAPSHSPSGAPEAEKKGEEMNSTDQKINEEMREAEGHETLLKKHHHGVDKSVAGGGVILGGLATTFFVAVFCYIRATARHEVESESTAK